MPKSPQWKSSPSMDRLHVSPAIGPGSSSRRADLIKEVALEFPDIESHELAIDPVSLPN